jgi:hypothetical protein
MILIFTCGYHTFTKEGKKQKQLINSGKKSKTTYHLKYSLLISHSEKIETMKSISFLRRCMF